MDPDQQVDNLSTSKIMDQISDIMELSKVMDLELTNPIGVNHFKLLEVFLQELQDLEQDLS